MPAASLPGCDECIRWSGEDGGATERLVVSPGHEREGIFHMPAGQSGHFLSAFYRDQQQDWISRLRHAIAGRRTRAPADAGAMMARATQSYVKK